VGRLALNHDDALQSRPFVAFLQPCDIVDHRIGSGLDAAVVKVSAAFAIVRCCIRAGKGAEVVLGHSSLKFCGSCRLQ